MKKDKKLLLTSIFTAIGASLCCITPVLALISGLSGIASTFSWIEPARPYLIGITVCILFFAWYQKLKPAEEVDCNCEMEEKQKFIQSKSFLGIVTIFAMLMLTFPYYGELFYTEIEKEVIPIDKSNVQNLTLRIERMTCSSCERHITHSVNQLDGIINVSASYEKGNAEIEFDKSKMTIKDIEKAVSSTGYKITNIKNY